MNKIPKRKVSVDEALDEIGDKAKSQEEYQWAVETLERVVEFKRREIAIKQIVNDPVWGQLGIDAPSCRVDEFEKEFRCRLREKGLDPDSMLSDAERLASLRALAPEVPVDSKKIKPTRWKSWVLLQVVEILEGDLVSEDQVIEKLIGEIDFESDDLFRGYKLNRRRFFEYVKQAESEFSKGERCKIGVGRFLLAGRLVWLAGCDATLTSRYV